MIQQAASWRKILKATWLGWTSALYPDESCIAQCKHDQVYWKLKYIDLPSDVIIQVLIMEYHNRHFMPAIAGACPGFEEGRCSAKRARSARAIF